jgi:hypothetical protein
LSAVRGVGEIFFVSNGFDFAYNHEVIRGGRAKERLSVNRGDTERTKECLAYD